MQFHFQIALNLRLSGRPPICPKPDAKILFAYRIKISMEYTHTYNPRNFILKLHFVYCIQYPKFFSRNYAGYCIQNTVYNFSTLKFFTANNAITYFCYNKNIIHLSCAVGILLHDNRDFHTIAEHGFPLAHFYGSNL